MATVIRFARHGSKKRPYYRIVVQDHHSPRDGRFIEHIGAYDPLKENSLNVERERLLYWLGTGAQMSLSVKNRLTPKIKEWNAGTTEAPAPAAPSKSASPKKSKEA